MPNKQTLQFVPITLATEMLIRDKYYCNDLFSMFIEYSTIDLKEVQTYLTTSLNVPLSFATALNNLLLKMPSQIQLVSNLLQPHLKHSLAFQLFTMTNDKKSYNKLKKFICFIDNLFRTLSNNEFLDQILKALFNDTLLNVFQGRIIGFTSYPIVARTAVQYLILILENVKSRQIAELIFHFLFGFTGLLPYHAIEEVMNNSRMLEVEASSFETSKLDSDTKSIYEYYSADNSEELNSLVHAVSAVIEDPKVSILEDCSSEDKKSPVLIQPGEKHDMKYTLIPTRASTTSNIKEFALDRHNSIGLTTVLITMLQYNPNGYSTIALQLFNQLLSFDIKEVYAVLVYNGIENFGCNYSELSVEEVIQLFPYYQKMLKEIKPVPVSDMYHGIDVLLSDSFFHFNAQTLPKPSPFVLRDLTMDTVQDVRKSCIVPGNLLTPKASVTEIDYGTPSKPCSPGEHLALPSELNTSPSFIIKTYENPFMQILLEKLERMLHNPFEENLFIASIILKLFSLPLQSNDESSVTLQGLLLDPNNISIINILKNIVTEIIKAYEKMPKLEKIIKRRRDVHRNAALNIVTPIKHDIKTNKLADVTSL